MTGFNMPPGCSANDIPGNRPEDVADEAFWEELDAKFEEQHPVLASILTGLHNANKIVVVNEQGEHRVVPESYTMAVGRILELARDMGYDRGYAEGQADEATARLHAEDQEVHAVQRSAREWERLCRRLLVLGDYGYGLDGLTSEIDDNDFLEDEWLKRWWGDGPEGRVADELAAIDLLHGAASGRSGTV